MHAEQQESRPKRKPPVKSFSSLLVVATLAGAASSRLAAAADDFSWIRGANYVFNFATTSNPWRSRSTFQGTDRCGERPSHGACRRHSRETRPSFPCVGLAGIRRA